MKSQNKRLANSHSHAASVSTIEPQGIPQSGRPALRGPYLLLVLVLLGSVSISGQVDRKVSQARDTPRRIDSNDFTKSRKEGAARSSTARSKRRRFHRLLTDATGSPRPLPAGNFMQLGITIWRLRSARKDDPDRRALIREKGKGTVRTAERITSDGILREGDYVRLSVESPRRGYLYVIDRELLADGTTGEPKLIFPWSAADNRLAPGRLIDIPGEEDDPNYFTASLTRQNQVGELLTFIVTSTPLNLMLSDEPLLIAPMDLTEWETSWGGVTERYEMEGGAGEVWTREEQQAAAKKVRRQLTRDDPVPQTIYRVFNKNNNGMLVNLRLKYENQEVAETRQILPVSLCFGCLHVKSKIRLSRAHGQTRMFGFARGELGPH